MKSAAFKTVVMVPTYNEKDNIGRLLSDLLRLDVAGHELRVLVVDDNSPDGTGKIVADVAAREPRVTLVTRYNERGRGSAGIRGFKEAMKQSPDFVVEMDADFSHDPKYVPELIKTAERGADLVLGSRFVDGGSDTDRGPYRRTVTLLAGIYIRTLFQLKVRDASSGFRCYRRSTLEKIGLDSLISEGPSIVLEMLYKTSVQGLKVAEVPIVFIDRRAGSTKLDAKILVKTLLMVARFRAMKERNQLFTPSPQSTA